MSDFSDDAAREWGEAVADGKFDECSPEFWREKIKEAPDFYFPSGWTDIQKNQLAIHLALWNTHSPYGANTFKEL